MEATRGNGNAPVRGPGLARDNDDETHMPRLSNSFKNTMIDGKLYI